MTSKQWKIIGVIAPILLGLGPLFLRIDLSDSLDPSVEAFVLFFAGLLITNAVYTIQRDKELDEKLNGLAGVEDIPDNSKELTDIDFYVKQLHKDRIYEGLYFLGTMPDAQHELIGRIARAKKVRNTNISMREVPGEFIDYRTNLDEEISNWVNAFVNRGGEWFDILGPFEIKRADVINANLPVDSNGQYKAKYYDRAIPYLNFVIFEFEDPSERDEVLFGFGLHGREHQPVFSSKSEDVIDEFKTLYVQLYNNCQDSHISQAVVADS